jgi:hypothetical protein
MRYEQKGFNPKLNRHFRAFYELHMIPGPDNNWALFVKRGKINSKNYIIEEVMTGTFKECNKKYEKLRKLRLKRGYEVVK